MQANKQDISDYTNVALLRAKLHQQGVYMPSTNPNDDLAYVIQL